MRFPNLVFDKREIDFGCILNDTEVMRPGMMTNNSPLPVRYAWYFLRRPPVVRQDPELLDEGVDMESDHESTEEEEILEKEGQEEEEEDSGKEKSEEEESQGSSKVELVSEESALEKEGGEGGEGEVERMEEGKGKEKDEEQREWSEEDGSEKVEVKGKKGEKGRKKGKKGEVRMEEGKVDEKMSEQTKENEDMMDTDPAMSNQVSVVISGEGDDTIDEIVSQVPVPGSTSKGEGENGQDAHVKIDSNAAMIDGDGVGSEHSSHHPSKHSSSGIPTSDARTLLSECSSNKKKRKKKRKKPPWELAFDPFKPIPISQVCIHAIPTTLSYLHPFSSPFPFFPPISPASFSLHSIFYSSSFPPHPPSLFHPPPLPSTHWPLSFPRSLTFSPSTVSWSLEPRPSSTTLSMATQTSQRMWLQHAKWRGAPPMRSKSVEKLPGCTTNLVRRW